MTNKKRREASNELFTTFILLIGIGGFYFTRSIVGAITVVIVTVMAILFPYILICRTKNAKLKKSGITEIDSMDGIQFEQYLSVLFKNLGYRSTVTQSTGDFGADLIIQKEHEKIVVQAKRYSKKVGIKAVQEVGAAKEYYKADQAWVVTNNFYTKAAMELATSNTIRLINRDELINLIVKMNPSAIPNPIEIKKSVQPKTVKCPICHSEMVIRKGKRGPFYGCSQFPRCRGTKDF